MTDANFNNSSSWQCLLQPPSEAVSLKTVQKKKKAVEEVLSKAVQKCSAPSSIINNDHQHSYF